MRMRILRNSFSVSPTSYLFLKIIIFGIVSDFIGCINNAKRLRHLRIIEMREIKS